MEIKDYNLNAEDLENIKNIKIGGHPSLDEKIDYIYRTLKHQRTMSLIWSTIRIFVIFSIIFLIFVYIPSLPQEKIDSYQEKFSNFMSERVAKVITPVVKNMVKDMTEDMVKDMTEDMVKDMTEDMVKDMNIEGINNGGTGTNSSKAQDELNRKMEILKKMNLPNNYSDL